MSENDWLLSAKRKIITDGELGGVSWNQAILTALIGIGEELAGIRRALEPTNHANQVLDPFLVSYRRLNGDLGKARLLTAGDFGPGGPSEHGDSAVDVESGQEIVLLRDKARRTWIQLDVLT